MSDFNQAPVANQPEDKLETLMKVLCFIFPIVGFILWIMNKDKFPVKAKTAGVAGIAGFVFWIVINVITTIISAL